MGLKRRNEVVIVEKQLTITAGAYSANDVIGGLITVPVCNPGGSGLLRHIIVNDEDNEKAAMKLHMFNAAPNTITDNAPFAPTFEDLKKRIGKAQVNASDYATWNSMAQAQVRDVNLDFETANGSLYFFLTPDSTPTYTATTDLVLTLIFWVDQ